MSPHPPPSPRDSSPYLFSIIPADSRRKSRAGSYSQLSSSLPRSAPLSHSSSSSLPSISHFYCSGSDTCTGMPRVVQMHRSSKRLASLVCYRRLQRGIVPLRGCWMSRIGMFCFPRPPLLHSGPITPSRKGFDADYG